MGDENGAKRRATSGTPRPRTRGGLARLDPHGVVVYWSATIARLTGIARAEAVGRHIAQLYPAGGAEDGTADAHLAAAARHGSHTTVGLRRSAAGFVRAQVVIDARHAADALHGFGYVVTPLGAGSRKPSGESVEERSQRLQASSLALANRAARTRVTRASVTESLVTYRRAFDLAPDGLLVTDRCGMILDMNVPALRLFGLDEGRVPHKPLAVYVARGSRPAFRQMLLSLGRHARVDDVALTILSGGSREAEVHASAALGLLDEAESAIVHWTLRPARDGTRSSTAQEAARRRLVQAAEEERAHLSREIHDVLGQALTALSLEVKALESEPMSPGAAERLHRVRALVASVSEQAHGIAQALRPGVLAELGLDRALHALAEEWGARAGIDVDFHAVGERARLPVAVETTLYRVAQEVMTNAARHARASRLSVVLETTPWQALLVVDDNGVGLDPTELERRGAGRLGLVGARERVALIGGTLTIESTPGAGTSVFVRVPLDREAGDGEPGDGVDAAEEI